MSTRYRRALQDDYSWRPLNGEPRVLVGREGVLVSYLQGENRPYLLKQTLNIDRRYYVVAVAGNLRRPIYIHRAVAEAFVHNPRPGYYDCISHEDNDFTNNHADNLTWCTRSESYTYKSRHGIVKGNESQPVLLVETGVTYPSMNSAAKALDISVTTVWRVANGLQESHRGLHFQKVSQ